MHRTVRVLLIALAVSTGAGAHSRVEIGTAVIGGMLTATALASFYIPLFFVFVRLLFRGHDPKDRSEPPQEQHA